ncbi:1,4-dihydroxy-2-naphthoate polyprenyltransferase [Reinekea marinisedimentorum]|uniref:1,4-dihydroxy-2-naphthoate octaprenyltransferase n=1 Tax=Reinekea marinisedimentorum TaxID=230495 RepID=A0A4R3I2L7_9GAMM|nr:1,4-dihydroxy-2-naphthoate polyprenyltransferase [Reinekea marinisedimentorum]TCS38905.1 1,4-dihydroxy-2-naphthoate octaprenyltransferase [Reinekea marinisedimentorum]
MTKLKPWWLAIRPKTLPASISPIILGTALAYQIGFFDGLLFALALCCALLLQIAVNLANDYFDARSGVDTEHRLGPVRVSQSGLVSPEIVKRALIVVSLLAVAAGIALSWLSSWWLLAFGVGAVVAVFIYSGGPWPLASNAMGEITVFFFFGWLAVGGTYFALAGSINMHVLGFGTVAGLLSAAIMLVNNIRDIPTDSVAGKHTLAVILGDHRARMAYRLLLVAAILVHLVVSFPHGLISVIPLVFMAPLFRRLAVDINRLEGKQLNTLLAQTAKLELFYCLLASAVLVVI